MIASSEVGDLQTVFYLVLVGAIILSLALFFLGVGVAGLPRLFRREEHPLLAALISGALGLTFVFLAVTGGALFFGVAHRG